MNAQQEPVQHCLQDVQCLQVAKMLLQCWALPQLPPEAILLLLLMLLLLSQKCLHQLFQLWLAPSAVHASASWLASAEVPPAV